MRWRRCEREDEAKQVPTSLPLNFVIILYVTIGLDACAQTKHPKDPEGRRVRCALPQPSVAVCACEAAGRGGAGRGGSGGVGEGEGEGREDLERG